MAWFSFKKKIFKFTAFCVFYQAWRKKTTCRQWERGWN